MKESIVFKQLICSEKNLDQIIVLINKNLDANYSKEFFKWKHLDNPFGQSYGLMAMDCEKIVGLRMFMFWKFFNKKENKILTAIRPVDTVVDGDYRGRGLFKKLTLMGLEDCKGKYDLIFNTPNESSLPGYLKMGWKKIPTGGFNLGLFNFFNFKSNDTALNQTSSSNFVSITNSWETLKNESFFKWRYKDSQYKYVSLNSANIIYVVKKLGFLKQIVVQDIVGEARDINQLLKEVCKNHIPAIVYYYVNQQTKSFKPIYSRKQKQAIVVAKEDIFDITDNINFSLGDLEAKL